MSAFKIGGSQYDGWYANPNVNAFLINSSDELTQFDLTELSPGTKATTNDGDHTFILGTDMEWHEWDDNGGGGGGGGTTNYNQLSNKPLINGVELRGNKTSNDLGLYPAQENGIPKTDLSEQVQESLEKADSAIQEHQSLSGYATEEWVENKGYLTEHQSLSGYATEEWVEDKGYLTEHQSLSGYATEDWVENQGYLKTHQDISGKLDSSKITHETWTFTLEDDTEVTKEVVLWTGV